MKKVLLLVSVFLVAIPALAFAGSATSRWDLTIGGFVKVEAGYSSQNAAPAPNGGIDQFAAGRDDKFGHQSVVNKAGDFGFSTGVTSLNFLVKGPDAWGAKTSAFVQGNFLGQTTNSGWSGTRYGTFTLSHAYMDFTWPTTKLTVGLNWQLWGFQPSYNFVGGTDMLLSGRGTTVPQITLTQTFAKSFYGAIGIQEPMKMMDQLGASNSVEEALNPQTSTTGINGPTGAPGQAQGANVRVTSSYPDVAGEFGFKSDTCGRIGPNVLQFALGGFWGRENVMFADPTNLNTYVNQHVDRWAAAFKWFVPIIPEHNLHKANALSLSGSVWTGQNLGDWFVAMRMIGGLTPYNQYGYPSVNYVSPVATGGWAQISYYFTDKVYINGLYSGLWNQMSNAYKNGIGRNQIHDNQYYIANIMYDVNPAVRVGIEGEYIHTHYGNYGQSSGGLGGGTSEVGNYPASTLLSNVGNAYVGRVGFWYFF